MSKGKNIDAFSSDGSCGFNRQLQLLHTFLSLEAMELVEVPRTCSLLSKVFILKVLKGLLLSALHRQCK